MKKKKHKKINPLLGGAFGLGAGVIISLLGAVITGAAFIGRFVFDFEQVVFDDAETQIADDLHTLDGVNIVMHVADFDAHAVQIIGQHYVAGCGYNRVRIISAAEVEKKLCDGRALGEPFPQSLVNAAVHVSFSLPESI